MNRLLAISSTGGHWVQLMRLAPAFRGCEVHFATSTADHRPEVEAAAAENDLTLGGYHVFTDANRREKLKLLRQMGEIAVLLARLRPDHIITTGASAGYFALRIGRLLRARTCWIDSIANAAELSLSGRLAGPYADLWLTQWADLARPDGPQFRGAVL